MHETPNDAGDALRSFCVWSSLPLRGYTLKLDAAAHDGVQTGAPHVAATVPERALLLPGNVVEAIARPSAGECARASGDDRLFVPPLPDGGPVLLILAPQ
jgi:hypothetical protein